MTFTEQFAQFSDTLTNLLSDLGSNYDNVYIFGDFNLDILKLEENKFISEYVDTLFSYGFLQIITKPTRVSDNSATLIDHILTNSLCEQFDSYILCHHISDHFPIIHNLNLKKSKVKQHKLKTRNFSLNNVNRFKGALSNYNWSHVIDKTNCPQAAYTNFDCTLNSLVDIYVLLTTKNFNSNFHKIEPWMTVGILTSHGRKNFLFSEKLIKKTQPTLNFSNNIVTFTIA